jgi:hypothetical protein
MGAIEAFVVGADGNYIAHLERAAASPFRKFSISEVRSRPGAGSFEYALPNAIVADRPDILNPGNVVMMVYQGRMIPWVIEEFKDLDPEKDGLVWREVSGRGALQLTYDRRLWPTDFDTADGGLPAPWDRMKPATWPDGQYYNAWEISSTVDDQIGNIVATTQARFTNPRGPDQPMYGVFAGGYGNGQMSIEFERHVSNPPEPSVKYGFRLQRFGDVLEALTDAYGDAEMLAHLNPDPAEITGDYSLVLHYWSTADFEEDLSADVVFEETIDVVSAQGNVSHRDAVTMMIAEGESDDSKVDQLAVAWRRAARMVEGYANARDVTVDAASVQSFADASLAVNAPVAAYDFEVKESRYKPYADYRVGSIVGFRYPSRGYDVAECVNGITLAEDEDDTLHVWLDLGSPRPDQTSKLARGVQTGDVSIKEDGSAKWAALHPTWIAPTLVNSWTNAPAPYGPASYAMCADGQLHMTGGVSGGAASSTICTLPAGLRPAYQVNFAVVGGAALAIIIVQTNGNVVFYSGTNTNVALDQVCFFPQQ